MKNWTPLANSVGWLPIWRKKNFMNYTTQNIPPKLRGWAEMEIPGADGMDIHFPFGKRMCCARFRREMGSLCNTRRKLETHHERGSWIVRLRPSRVDQVKIHSGRETEQHLEIAIMSSYGEVAATGNPSGRAMSLLHAGNRAVNEDSREKDQVRVSNLLNDSWPRGGVGLEDVTGIHGRCELFPILNNSSYCQSNPLLRVWLEIYPSMMRVAHQALRTPIGDPLLTINLHNMNYETHLQFIIQTQGHTIKQ